MIHRRSLTDDDTIKGKVTISTRKLGDAQTSLGFLLGLRMLLETVLLQLNFAALLREGTTTATPRSKAIVHGAPTNVVA